MNPQGVSNANPKQLHVGYPIAYLVNVKRIARHHVSFQSVRRSGFECSGKLQQLTQGHICFYGVHNFAGNIRNARNNFRRGNFIHASRHECLLTFDATNIAFRVSIAHVSHSSLAVHVLLSRIKVNDKSAVIVPGVFVVHALLNVNIHAANRVDYLYKAARVNQYVMVNVNAEEVFNRRLGKGYAAISKRRVNLVIAAPTNLDASITRD